MRSSISAKPRWLSGVPQYAIRLLPRERPETQHLLYCALHCVSCWRVTLSIRDRRMARSSGSRSPSTKPSGHQELLFN